MQILKIDSTNFNGKYNKPIKEVAKKATESFTNNPQTSAVLAGLTGLATIGATNIVLEQKKEKSFDHYSLYIIADYNRCICNGQSIYTWWSNQTY